MYALLRSWHHPARSAAHLLNQCTLHRAPVYCARTTSQSSLSTTSGMSNAFAATFLQRYRLPLCRLAMVLCLLGHREGWSAAHARQSSPRRTSKPTSPTLRNVLRPMAAQHDPPSHTSVWGDPERQSEPDRVDTRRARVSFERSAPRAPRGAETLEQCTSCEKSEPPGVMRSRHRSSSACKLCTRACFNIGGRNEHDHMATSHLQTKRIETPSSPFCEMRRDADTCQQQCALCVQ